MRLLRRNGYTILEYESTIMEFLLTNYDEHR